MGAAKFLEAEWRWMAVVNYPAPEALLRPLLPQGLEPDTWQGSAWVSLAALQFLRPRAFGVPLLFPRSFAEVNLRTYVRGPGLERRGLVFLEEVVSSPVVALGARLVQNKQYRCAPMRHSRAQQEMETVVEYAWSVLSHWNRLTLAVGGDPTVPEPGSAADFFTQHYRGFGRSREGRTVSYEVEHPPWRSWEAVPRLEGAARSFDERFASLLAEKPASAFLIEGSPVVVRRAAPV